MKPSAVHVDDRRHRVVARWDKSGLVSVARSIESPTCTPMLPSSPASLTHQLQASPTGSSSTASSHLSSHSGRGSSLFSYTATTPLASSRAEAEQRPLTAEQILQTKEAQCIYERWWVEYNVAESPSATRAERRCQFTPPRSIMFSPHSYGRLRDEVVDMVDDTDIRQQQLDASQQHVSDSRDHHTLQWPL
jgi:hypothetical protein